MKRPGSRSALWAGWLSLAGLMIFALIAGPPVFAAAPTYVPGGTLDPTTIPKYVIPLVIPPPMPTSTSGLTPAANYDIAVRQFKQQILPGGLWNLLNGRADTYAATTVWSYGRYEDPAPDITLLGPPFNTLPTGVAPAANTTFNYPAFTVENSANVATTVRWMNDLVDPATGKYLPHLLPVDQTTHWANPPAANCVKGYPDRTDCETAIPSPYTGPVPLVTHVHGAHVQPHSDGYAQAWYLPGAPGTKGIPTSYAEHGSLYSQANTANAVPGSAYYAYENSQAAATIWYHDHALGMTRLNVVAGPAGFWLIRGGAFGDANATVGAGGPTAVLPGPAPTIGGGDPNFDVPAGTRAKIREIPVAIQDRAFNIDGQLFYPDSRLFFDGFTGPYIGYTGTPAGPSDISPIWNPEVFFNTIVVNGNTWPQLTVAPARYRLRLLNGCTARTLNLSMFIITGPGADTQYGTADDTMTAVPSVLGAEVPFYQIGAEQGFLPNVVKIVTGSFTTLDGTGGPGVTSAAPDPVQALLMMPAERADVIVDFTGMAPGTRIRMFNTAPDSPFGGFVGSVPSDALTTGQVMDFIVDAALTQIAPHSDATSTAPANLVLPAEPAVGAATFTRQVSLNELVSDQVCVEVDPVSGAIFGTLFSTFPGDPTFLTSCAAAGVGLPGGHVAEPMGPRKAQMGTVALSGPNLVAVPKEWLDPVTEMPLLNSTEVWEMYNTTADAHPVHLHLVSFNLINRELLDAAALAAGNLVLTGTVSLPLPNEMGRKDTITTYPGEVTRVRATFDIPGLYVWHCHIVDHEDNEMMRPFIVNPDLLYANYGAGGLHKWDGASWIALNSVGPTSMVAAGPVLYANYGAGGLHEWNGTSWIPLNSVGPTSMVAAGPVLYANYGAGGLHKWDGASWIALNSVGPTNMVAADSVLYANYGAGGLHEWNGSVWTKLSNAAPTSMAAADALLYAQFAGMGLWQWDGRAWIQIAPSAASGMAIADPLTATTGPVLYATFTGYGLWKWDGSEWSQINPTDPTSIMAAGAILYADYGASGLQKWDGTAWTQINAAAPANAVAAGEMLYANYGAGGLHKWDGTSWTMLNTAVPTTMATGF